MTSINALLNKFSSKKLIKIFFNTAVKIEKMNFPKMVFLKIMLVEKYAPFGKMKFLLFRNKCGP